MSWSFQKPFVRVWGDFGAFECASDLIEKMAGADGLEFLIDVNGGDAAQVFKVHDALKGRVGCATILNRAVSAGYLLATVADKIKIARNGHIVLHPPKIAVYGALPRIELAVASIAEVTERCIQTVSARRGIKTKAVSGWYRDGREHVFTAQEALNAGLIDEIFEPLPKSVNPVFPEIATAMDDGKASLLIELLRALGPIQTVNADKLRRELYQWQAMNVRQSQ